MPTTTDGTGTLGPGTLKIGQTGTLIDASCLVNNAKITAEVTEGDSKVMLCGTTKKKPDTYTYALTGNVDVDAGLATGLFALTQQNVGATVDFEYTPSTAVGTQAAGQLILAPLDFGADNAGDFLASDFSFTLVDWDPATGYTYPAAAVAS